MIIKAHKQIISTGSSTTTTKQDYVVIWYPLEALDDVDKSKVSINVTGKDDDNAADVVDDDDKRTSSRRGKTNTRVSYL